MKPVHRTMLNTWNTVRRQEWECPWNLILVILQFAILFFSIFFRNAYVNNWAEESLLLRDMKIVTIYLFGSHAAAMVLMLTCFHLMVGTVPKQIKLSIYGMGKEVWLAIFLVVLITLPANLSRSTGYIPPIMYLPDLSIIRLLQGVIVIPLVEEWLFRGLLYTYLKRHLPFVWAIIANVVIFSLCHYNIGGHLLALLPHLGLGLVIVIYYERSRSIGSCIVLHGVANIVAELVFSSSVYRLDAVL